MGGSDRRDRLARAAQRLRSAVLGSAAVTSADLRRAAFEGVATDAAVARYVTTVREHAFRVTDADVAGLSEHGLSDDAIFEVTVAAALGAAQQRLDAALALLDRDGAR